MHLINAIKTERRMKNYYFSIYAKKPTQLTNLLKTHNKDINIASKTTNNIQHLIPNYKYDRNQFKNIGVYKLGTLILVNYYFCL